MSRVSNSVSRPAPTSHPARHIRAAAALVLSVCAPLFAGTVEAVARVSPTVVTITTSRLAPNRPGERQPFGVVQRTSLGSGFVFDDSGHVLTCNHVVAGYEEIEVELADGTRL
ncbi:hypothetical protein JXB37_07705, partial [candidate division WOR-3 bacterium]|nr:hypothetical protein [candidate division WOR-3 bacterium]